MQRTKEAAWHRNARRVRTQARTLLRNFVSGTLYPSTVIRAAAFRLQQHHSASALPSQALRLLGPAEGLAQEAMASTPWKCACGSLNKQSASFCPSCGQPWQRSAGGSPRRRAQQTWEAWHPPYAAQLTAGDVVPWQEQPAPWRTMSPRRRRGNGGGRGQGQQPKGAQSGPKGPPPHAKGRGKAKSDETQASAPSLESLPPAPTAAAPALPRRPSEASSASQPEKAQLDHLLSLLAAAGTAIPENVRVLVDEHQKSTAQTHARSLHKAVTERSRARTELQRLRSSRTLAAWGDYLEQLGAVLEKQLSEQTAILEHFNTSEVEWMQADRESTLAISRMAADEKPVAEVEDQEMEDDDTRVSEAIEAEARLTKDSEEHQKAGRQLQAAIQAARKQAAENLQKHQREMSRTPRRRSEVEPDAAKEPANIEAQHGAATTPFKLGPSYKDGAKPPDKSPQ